ncbi:Erg28-like protein [Mytilinidion resinicola]|uniref:Erg28-like protein n=1 Tax=Mytilinidion resinicola TaxID=574789 RepID=A0A6A6Y0M8_9PEZI|nr:Erg28-like protein [Mytilinidion resinicola]KAF2802073.1 Erg28-like protein [Mytilinidion resinicola]
MAATDILSALIPSSPGLLPYWLLITSFLSILNFIACYTSPPFFLRTYSNPFPNSPPPKPTTRSSQKSSTSASESTVLPARIFGTWTLLACILRTYAAYALDHTDIYAITLSTYLIALGHFTSEWLIYGTMTLKGGLAPPLFFSTTTTLWMLSQWGTY